MPTPKEWLENLEHIKSIVEKKPTAEPEPAESAEKEEPTIREALDNISEAMEDAAEKLLTLIKEVPEEHHKEFTTGFLTGLVLYVIGSMAHAQQDK